MGKKQKRKRKLRLKDLVELHPQEMMTDEILDVMGQEHVRIFVTK